MNWNPLSLDGSVHRLQSRAVLAPHSCGPELLEEYRLDDATFDFRFTITPVTFENII